MNDQEVLTRLLHAIDALDWTTIRDAFADEVRVDYTSLWGGEPETLTADDLIARWKGLLPGFDATQHLTGPILLTPEDDAAVRVDTHVRGYHYMRDPSGNELWAVHGHYVARIEAGRITALTLQVFYQEGNPDLPAVATGYAASSPRRASA
jgi:hypothetical protein